MEKKKNHVLLVSIIPQRVSDEEILKDLTELQSLVTSFGGEVKAVITQRREIHDKGSYIGRGKIDESLRVIKQYSIGIVVLNAIVKPGQLYDLKSIFQKENPGVEVWDRVDLILHIFSNHAKTAEAKLQIELAAMRHMGPRIYGMGMVLSRQSGGIGTRGIGETNTELMRRHWRDQMKKTTEKLEKLSLDKSRQLDRRRKNGMKTVALVGYTNAGKTSLFNILTKKKKTVKNALFATLDSSVGKVYLPNSQEEVLVSDTIGFIQNLPAELIDAFSSTLMEAINADMLLVVIDSADPDCEKKITVVENVIHDLGIASTKRIYILNKIDNTDSETLEELSWKYAYYSPQQISVTSEEGIEELLKCISAKLGK